MDLHTVNTPLLRIGYFEAGDPKDPTAVLLHGFPYDAHACVEAGLQLATDGWHVIAPWLRGFGPTTFHSPETMRSGEQAALGSDLLAFLDALEIEEATLAGYDWGGRAACVVAALWPERVAGLITGNGYNIFSTRCCSNRRRPIRSGITGTPSTSTRRAERLVWPSTDGL